MYTEKRYGGMIGLREVSVSLSISGAGCCIAVLSNILLYQSCE